MIRLRLFYGARRVGQLVIWGKSKKKKDNYANGTTFSFAQGGSTHSFQDLKYSFRFIFGYRWSVSGEWNRKLGQSTALRIGMEDEKETTHSSFSRAKASLLTNPISGSQTNCFFLALSAPPCNSNPKVDEEEA